MTTTTITTAMTATIIGEEYGISVDCVHVLLAVAIVAVHGDEFAKPSAKDASCRL